MPEPWLKCKCGCPLMLPREQEASECIYCTWDKENGWRSEEEVERYYPR